MDLFAFAAQAEPSLFAVETIATPAPKIAPILIAVDALVDAIGTPNFSRQILDSIMTDAFGGTDASGAWTAQQAYNALEGALAKRLVTQDEEPTLDAIVSLLSRFPAQNRRTADKDAFQQFSTPPTIGLIAATLASASPHDVIMEPSAGTGLLGVFAARLGATLILNEIDSERLRIAKHALQANYAHSFDAKYLGVYAKRLGATPSVVVMNPPFSSDGGAEHSSRVGLQHVLQAASVLRPGGRLVTVLASFQHPELRPDLWENVLEVCSIRAAYMVGGKAYHKLGTDFDTCVVALDKRTGLDAIDVQSQPTTVEAILKHLPQIPRLDVGTARVYDTTLAPVAVTKKELKNYVPTFDAVETLTYAVAAPVDRQDEGVFVQYAPYLDIEGAKPHPEALVESAALACVRPPTPTVEVRLPVGVKDRLSVAQLESVIYAAQAHSREIELIRETDDQGDRATYDATAGIMFGHGTGFGKGRTMGGILAHNFAEGRTKAMWFSENQTLFEDAQRDIRDVFGEGHEHALFNVSDTQANMDIVRQHGIMFGTYATLRSEGRQCTRSRLDQITAWAGSDFDGVIVLDESHNLANATEAEGSRGKTKASKQAIAAIELQLRFPKARLVYTSATSASKLEAFLYAPRLGLWGPNTAFPTQEQFVTQLGSGGTAAMELLCRDAKSLGVYLAANLSMAAVTFERLEHTLTEEQTEQYDAIAQAWLIIDQEARRILEQTEAGGMAKGAALSKLESTRLRCLQSVLVTSKLPTVIRHIEDALKNDKSAVIQLTNTYEAAQERALSRLSDDEGADLEDLDLSPKEQIFAYLDQAFPVAQYTTRVVNGKMISEPMLDADEQPIANPDAIAAREALKEKINSLIIPMSPLDILLDHFGTDIVAEVTGRKRRVVTKTDAGQRVRVIESRNEHSNSAETEAFMRGTKRILIFSEAAGGTGRSYHASLNVENQQQRYHYLLQTGWRSDRAIQGLGRTHRTYQAIAPHWILTLCDAPGERRFISTIARRLEELGACTRGQRDAASTGLFSAVDNLETEYTATAITALLHRIAADRCDEIPYDMWMENTNFNLHDDRDDRPKVVQVPVPRFLNKMLASPLAFQHILMNLLMVQLEATIAAAKTAGTFDNGIETLDAISIHLEKSVTIYEDALSAARTELVTLDAEYKTKTTSFGTALSKLREQRQRYPHLKSEFVKHIESDAIHAFYPLAMVWTDERGTAHPYWRSITPSRVETLKTRPGYGYRSVSDDVAAEMWSAEYESIGETVKVPVYIVSGTLLPIYDRLPNDFAKVVRVTLDNGDRVIGRIIDDCQLHGFLQKFNMDEALDVDTILARLRNKATLRLSNGYVLKQVRFMDDVRVECILSRLQAQSDAPYLRVIGMIHERVDYAHRFFVPAGAEAAVIAKLLERNTAAIAA